VSSTRIVPVFVSGAGCPERCVYCDQRNQTGVVDPPTDADVTSAIESAGREGELAFYGGTFTGLPERTQRALLRPASEAQREGRLGGIRVSTHPRWCSPKQLLLLREFSVGLVELGVQSLDDDVLKRCRRGVDSGATLAAFARVREVGLRLGVQTMPGLPGADRDSDKRSARVLSRTGAELARVYPTCVVRGTELEAWWRAGDYRPLDVPEAVVRSADQVAVFEAAGVRVQRIGLHVDEHLRRAVLAGPVDEAFGEKVRSELAWRRLQARAEGLESGATLRVDVPARELSQWLGWRRENVLRFEREFPEIDLAVTPV